jgi:hypothetical protein
MIHVSISCHADLQALQARSDGLMFLKFVSLESLSIASDSYALLLRNLIERRYWQCPQIHLLSLVAGVAVELDKIKHDLYPLLSREAKLGDDGFVEHLLLLKNSALALVRLAKDAKEIVQGLDQEVVIDGLLGKVKKFGKVVEDTADLVLKGTHNIAWLQKRLPSILDPVDLLLLTPVQFPDPHK